MDAFAVGPGETEHKCSSPVNEVECDALRAVQGLVRDSCLIDNAHLVAKIFEPCWLMLVVVLIT
ncbi:hypothetical protein TorRG33x02_132480 [Trema orientale]|uniref:Uncharacterized protein n=1 Tax=Trema orientale TaxID=63057 RepID=A0A2P5EZR6_TREOI|nr:hypothetical protein TorRG33x02_132480 [Trema orientale]